MCGQCDENDRKDNLESERDEYKSGYEKLESALAEAKELSELRLKSEQKYAWENLAMRAKNEKLQEHINHQAKFGMTKENQQKFEDLRSICGELFHDLQLFHSEICRRINCPTAELLDKTQSILSGGGKE